MKHLTLCVVLVLAGACGGDDDSCDPTDPNACDDGLSCEVVVTDDGEDNQCFPSVVVRGAVFDLADDSAIGGARVVALDVNQAPASSVDISESDGSYELVIPSERDADGNPAGYDITLRADAAGYLPFPGGLRQALPIDTGAAERDGDGPWVVELPVTDIGLIPDPDAGTASIHGTAEIPGTRVGVLVVAESGGVGYSAIADRDGSYGIFNLPPGDYDVTAYARGVNYDAAQVSLAGGDEAEVDLDIANEDVASVSGMVDIVDGGLGTGTSVVLVVRSTFDEVLRRGATPPGLRAPEAGLPPDITGAFTIDGVPAGEYVILAAFENDFLVRDPDLCIAGTELVFQTVGVGEEVTVGDVFKITGALDINSPGADAPEAVSGTPTFSVPADASAKAYDVLVVDSYGEVVWEHRELEPPGDPVEISYGGPALEAGVYYQVRITSVRKIDPPPECNISETEDLKGVFYLE